MAKLLTWDVKSLQKIDLIPQYWENLKPQNDIDAETEDLWKKKIEFIDQISVQNNVVVFLWNTFTNRFLYMSDKLKVLAGLDPSLFTAENGVEYSLSLIYPGHLAAGLQLNQKLINYCAENNIRDYNTASMCMNYLYKNGNNQYVQVLQKVSILEVDEVNQPSLALSFIHYVGHIKKQYSVGGVFCNPAGIVIFEFDQETNSLRQGQTISEQEKKIIQLLAQGLDTKEIAENLAISPHTVNTHRRNLIKKTSCIDTTAVVAFAKLVNLI